MLNKEINNNISMKNILKEQTFIPLNENYFLEIFEQKQNLKKKMSTSVELDNFFR